MDTFRERFAQKLPVRTIWIADAHRGDGKRFVARADEKLTAFMELVIRVSEPIYIDIAGFVPRFDAIK
jgi:hypothetical protein